MKVSSISVHMQVLPCHFNLYSPESKIKRRFTIHTAYESSVLRSGLHLYAKKKQKIVKKNLLIGEKGRNLRNSDRRGISLPEWTCTRCVIVPSQVVSQSCWWLKPILMIVGPNSIWMLFLLALHWGQFTSPCIIARDWNAAPLMFIVIRPCGMWMLTQKCSQLDKSSAVWPSWESGSPTHPNLKQRSSETTTFSTDLLVCS